jgi:tripartite-type tricarboxylate transporter receptor subunit TctC
LLWLQTGTSGIHVPYKGGAPAITDLLGAQVDISFQNINAVIQHVRSGKLRALAITSDKRSPLLPDVPTLNESGVKGANVYSWQAIAAPRGLPAEIKARLHGALVAALADRSIKERFVDVGFEIVGNTPEQFAAFQAAEFARWKRVIETRGIQAD